jgi:hypothetical protein
MDPAWINFCRKHGFRPFAVEEENIDLDSGLIESLMDAFKNGGYDRSSHVIIAKSENSSIDGEVIDGRHRAIAAYRLAKKGITVRFPPIETEDIPDIETLNCRIAHFVQLSRSKSPALARRIVERRIKDVIEAKIDQYGDRLPDHIVKMGFSSATIVNKLIDEMKEKRRSKGSKQKAMRANHPALQNDSYGLNEDWGVSKRFPNESVHAKPEDKFDEIRSVRECPCGCKPPKTLTIITDLKGSVLDVKAPEQAEIEK